MNDRRKLELQVARTLVRQKRIYEASRRAMEMEDFPEKLALVESVMEMLVADHLLRSRFMGPLRTARLVAHRAVRFLKFGLQTWALENSWVERLAALS